MTPHHANQKDPRRKANPHLQDRGYKQQNQSIEGEECWSGAIWRWWMKLPLIEKSWRSSYQKGSNALIQALRWHLKPNRLSTKLQDSCCSTKLSMQWSAELFILPSRKLFEFDFQASNQAQLVPSTKLDMLSLAILLVIEGMRGSKPAYLPSSKRNTNASVTTSISLTLKH